MCECVSEDAEGRSSAVPLMVSARELKCIPLTASERVCATNYSRPPHSQEKEKKNKKTHGCACSRRAVNLLPIKAAVWGCQFWSLRPPPLSNWSLQAETEVGLLAFCFVLRGAARHGNNGTLSRCPGATWLEVSIETQRVLLTRQTTLVINAYSNYSL